MYHGRTYIWLNNMTLFAFTFKGYCDFIHILIIALYYI